MWRKLSAWTTWQAQMTTLKKQPALLGGISSSVLSVFFTDKFALSQSDARISVAYNSCQWKTLTKHLMKCPPGLTYTSQQTREEKFAEMKQKIDLKIVNDSHKRAATASKQHLNALLDEPSLLVGKRVDHLFKADKTDKWDTCYEWIENMKTNEKQPLRSTMI